MTHCPTCGSRLAWRNGSDYCIPCGLAPSEMFTSAFFTGNSPAVVRGPAITHLTYTGPWAGQTLCGVRRSVDGAYVHAVYCRDLTRPDLCPDCLNVWHAAETESLP